VTFSAEACEACVARAVHHAFRSHRRRRQPPASPPRANCATRAQEGQTGD
jgi:hypothetical protein